jgi:phage terminase small subunit
VRPVVNSPPAHEQLGLTEAQYTFALQYLENGFNATQAYKKAHPDAVLTTCATEGWRTLRIPKVAAFLRTKSEIAWKELQMGGEEALARTALAVTFDVRTLFDDQGRLLPVSQWPDEAGVLIESIDMENGKLKLPSRLAALRVILEQSGKLKSIAGGLDELAEAIRADKAAHGEAKL